MVVGGAHIYKVQGTRSRVDLFIILQRITRSFISLYVTHKSKCYIQKLYTVDEWINEVIEIIFSYCVSYHTVSITVSLFFNGVKNLSMAYCSS